MFRALVAVAAQNNPTYGTHLPFPFSLSSLAFLNHLVLFIFLIFFIPLVIIVRHVLVVSHIVPPSISGLRQPWSLVEGDFVSDVVSNSASCAAQMPATLQDDRRYSGNCDKPQRPDSANNLSLHENLQWEDLLPTLESKQALPFPPTRRVR